MKTFHRFKASLRCLSFGLILFLGSTGLQAGDAAGTEQAKDQTKPSTKSPAQDAKVSKAAAEKKKVLLTGSHLPRKVRDYRSVGEAFSPTYVIDQEQIQQSGAATVAGVLRRTVPYSR